jgi:exodeoxyribonuclease VII small subunit
MAGKEKEPKYGEAVQELERIISEIEGESVDVDALTEKVKRATFLIGLCKEKLSSTEVEVKKALEGLEEDPDSEADDPF